MCKQATVKQVLCFIFTHIFTILGDYFQILYWDFAWFMWKRVHCEM